MYRIIDSTLSDRMAEAYTDFENEFGIGPCGAWAALKRSEGWGDVGVGTAMTLDMAARGQYGFGHYFIVDGLDIIDQTNPFDDPLVFNDIEVLSADEMPECVTAEMIEWLKERGI